MVIADQLLSVFRPSASLCGGQYCEPVDMGDISGERLQFASGFSQGGKRKRDEAARSARRRSQGPIAAVGAKQPVGSAAASAPCQADDHDDGRVLAAEGCDTTAGLVEHEDDTLGMDRCRGRLSGLAQADVGQAVIAAKWESTA